MKKYTQQGGINQPPLYVCASGCDMAYHADELRVYGNGG